MQLEKRLPAASGIGGGSADAAAALRLLNRLWELEWPLAKLSELGVSIGADVPMCLVSRPARARGVGDDTSLLPAFPALHLVLVNPGIAVPTAAVFARLSGRFTGPLPVAPTFGDAHTVIAYLLGTANDLEGPAVESAPVIADVLAALRSTEGCRIARMSGSGATCFGIYPDGAAAKSAAAAIEAVRPDWWVVETQTASST